MGSRGERNLPVPDAANGMAVVGRGTRKSLSGFQGARRLFGRKGQGKADAFLVMGCRGSSKAPRLVMQRPNGASAQPAIRLNGVVEARRLGNTTTWGMQRGRAAAPLPRLRYYTAHLAIIRTLLKRQW